MILIEEVISNLQKELGAINSTDAHPDMYRYINSAGRFIYAYRDWGWNKRVFKFQYPVANVEITIPFAMKAFNVKLDGELVKYLYNSEEWFQADSHDNGVGIFGELFVSENTGIYEIQYSPFFPEVDSTSTEIDLPVTFQDTLHSIAIHFAYKDVKDYETAMPLLSAAKAMMDSVSERTVNQRPRQVTRLGSKHSF